MRIVKSIVFLLQARAKANKCDPWITTVVVIIAVVRMVSQASHPLRPVVLHPLDVLRPAPSLSTQLFLTVLASRTTPTTAPPLLLLPEMAQAWIERRMDRKGECWWNRRSPIGSRSAGKLV